MSVFVISDSCTDSRPAQEPVVIHQCQKSMSEKGKKEERKEDKDTSLHATPTDVSRHIQLPVLISNGTRSSPGPKEQA